VVFSHLTSSWMSRKSRWRSFSCASSVGNLSGCADGSATICAKITARAAANGRRAHQRCSVLGCPWRIDFSRAEALLMASSGKATSMSFFLMNELSESVIVSLALGISKLIKQET
jgi:hypothetical protein